MFNYVKKKPNISSGELLKIWNQNGTESKDNSSLKQFEIARLLTESSNQFLTDLEDEDAILSPGSSSGVLKTG